MDLAEIFREVADYKEAGIYTGVLPPGIYDIRAGYELSVISQLSKKEGTGPKRYPVDDLSSRVISVRFSGGKERAAEAVKTAASEMGYETEIEYKITISGLYGEAVSIKPLGKIGIFRNETRTRAGIPLIRRGGPYVQRVHYAEFDMSSSCLYLYEPESGAEIVSRTIENLRVLERPIQQK
jgi:hypothetical protein